MGILLGLINVAIVVAILILIGYLVVWMFSLIGFGIPDTVQKIYMVIVALIALYMIAALAAGIPTFKIVQHQSPQIGAHVQPAPSIMRPER
jgi:bacteriorhodopsin